MKIIKTAQKSKEVSADILSSYVETLKLYRGDNASVMSKDMVRLIDSLPARSYVSSSMDSIERQLSFETVGYVWKQLTGDNIRTEPETIALSNNNLLDGNYWMVPGGILLKGFNHFSSAKKHAGLLCSLLGINRLVFESKSMQKDPDLLIKAILSHGGIRVNINRDSNSVFMQTNEKSWPWAREKLRRMYHKKKMAKVLDPDQPYLGWKSGVPVLVK